MKTVFLIILLAFLFYAFNMKTPPIDYWDEYHWIGRSYFFELFIQGDFKNSLWKGYYSYDQPKLAEYFYGLILYPKYIIEKANKKERYDLAKYLIDNNFYTIEGKTYAIYKKELNSFVTWSPDVKSRTFAELINKYGKNFEKTVSLIYFSRLAAGLILALTAGLIFLLAREFFNTFWAFIVVILYITNSIIVYAGLKATSEALFLFFFLWGLLMLLKIFSQPQKNIFHLLLFSSIAALAAQTKLNGLMLLIFYNFFLFALIIKRIIKKNQLKIKKILLQFILVNGLYFLIFSSLHPFIYPSIFKNILFLYKWRYHAAQSQQKTNPHDALNHPHIRLSQIYNNFYRHVETNYNLPYIFFTRRSVNYGNRIIFRSVKLMILVKFLLFLFGFIALTYSTVHSIRRLITIDSLPINRYDKKIVLFFSSFLFMIFFITQYLLLNWIQYYVVLVFPIIMIEVYGLTIIIERLKLLLQYGKRKYFKE